MIAGPADSCSNGLSDSLARSTLMPCPLWDVLCDCSGFSRRATTCALRTARAYAVFILPCALCGMRTVREPRVTMEKRACPDAVSTEFVTTRRGELRSVCHELRQTCAMSYG